MAWYDQMLARGRAAAQGQQANMDNMQGAAGIGLFETDWNQRANAYQLVRTGVLTSIRGCTPDVVKRVQELVRKMDVAGVAAPDAARSLIPQVQFEQNKPLYAQNLNIAAYVSNVIAAKRSMLANALDGATDEATSIVSAALLAAIPVAPRNVDDNSLSETRQDLRLLLTGGGNATAKATQILDDAMASGDTMTVYALLGAPSAMFVRSTGVDVDALRQRYVFASDGGADFQPYAMAGTIIGAAFIRAQVSGTGASLAELIQAATAAGQQGIMAIETALTSSGNV